MKKKNDIYLKAAKHFFNEYKNEANCGLCYHISQITEVESYDQLAIKKVSELFLNDCGDFYFGSYRENAEQRMLTLLFMHEIVNDKK